MVVAHVLHAAVHAVGQDASRWSVAATESTQSQLLLLTHALVLVHDGLLVTSALRGSYSSVDGDVLGWLTDGSLATNSSESAPLAVH